MEKIFPHDCLRGRPGPVLIQTNPENTILVDCDYVYSGTTTLTKIPREIFILENDEWKPCPVVTVFQNEANPRQSYSVTAIITPGNNRTLTILQSPLGMPPDHKLFKTAKKEGLLTSEPQI
jgi:hypothetical protein